MRSRSRARGSRRGRAAGRGCITQRVSTSDPLDTDVARARARARTACPSGCADRHLHARGRQTRVLIASEAARTFWGMDRASLESFLERGLSLAEIGRRVGRHESTVGYWVRKYGLAT